jgi:polyisoprenyl-teichoic acid--peptidoglycan teichoic acid transferase
MALPMTDTPSTPGTPDTPDALDASGTSGAPGRPRRSDRTPRERKRDRRRGRSSSGRHAASDRAGGRSGRTRGSTPVHDEARGSTDVYEPARAPTEPARRPGPVRGRRSRTWLSVLIGVVLGAIVIAILVVSGVMDRAVEIVAPEGGDAVSAAPIGDRQPSLVLVTHDETDASGQASALAVLAYDRVTEQGTIVLVPTATIADVPGYGSFQLREAFALGRAPLVDVSLANLLGVRFDGAASVSHAGWSALLERVDGYEVSVRSRLVASTDAGDEARFEPGAQFLDGPRLAEYLTFRTESETELETLPRVQDVLLGLFDRLAEDPALLDAMFADGAAMIDRTDTTDLGLVRALFEQLSEARADGRVTTVTLPVATLGSGREDSYRLDAARAGSLLGEPLEASRPTEGAGVGRGVQILNGNGLPAIGQQVAERLGDGGYRVVLTGNADTFDYETTRIVIYDDSPQQLAVAEDVRERLGVGEIQRSATTQSVVDVTIVVGADFTG